MCNSKCKAPLAPALWFLMDTWMLADFLAALDFEASKGSSRSFALCQLQVCLFPLLHAAYLGLWCPSGVAQGEPSMTRMSFGVLKRFTPEHTHFTTDHCKSHIFSMRHLPFPIWEGCDKQMLAAPRRGLTFCLVQSRWQPHKRKTYITGRKH